MTANTQEESATRVAPDPNLACLEAELRLLWLRLESVMRTPGAGEPAAQNQDAETEEKKLELFLNSLRREAEVKQWRLCLDDFTAGFQLNDFETKLLLLAAAPEMEDAFGPKIAQAQTCGSVLPSVELAWRLFCPSLQSRIESRDSLRSDSPLFRFRLLEMEGADAPLPGRLLRADRRIVDALAGRDLPDARIAPQVRFIPAGENAAAAANSPAARLAQCVREFLDAGVQPPSQLILNCHGAGLADLEAFAVETCRLAGIPLLVTEARNIPEAHAPYFIRESALLSTALFAGFESQETAGPDWARWLAWGGPVVFIGSERAWRIPRELETRIWLPIAVKPLDVWNRAKVWERSLRELGLEANGSISALAANFELSAVEIARTARQAANLSWLNGEALQMGHVLSACHREVHHRMGELAQQMNTRSGWDDLLLPDEAREKLHELCAQVKCQHIVLDKCGFGARLSRGRGITALFAGPSGTGKTMAAEVVAHELQRELYRIDLARVVSKYIGETEKNLRQAVAEAEKARCVLLFDEADALFGRRTEVRDSHDRYANIEVSYLLQLLEETESAVILLATNRRDAIDEAFLRRFRFLIEFPLPDAEVRRKLWASSFPPEVDLRGVGFQVLADRLPLSGASIKNIALAATYLAANDGGVVGSKQLAHATRRELERMGRPAPFNEADFGSKPETPGTTK